MGDDRRGRRSTYEHSKTAAPEPGDEHQGEWPRERLLAMDEKFMARRACACSWSRARGSVTRDHRYGRPYALSMPSGKGRA